MTTKSIKISEDTYKMLIEYASVLQIKKRRKVSIDEAIKNLLHRRISDFSESWEMNDKEYTILREKINKVWKTWQSV